LKGTIVRPSILTPIAVILGLAAGPGHAGAPAGPFQAVDAVAPAVLATCRGGSTTASGLSVTLGIERIVTVDGQVAARSELQLGDLGRLAAGASPPPTLASAQLATGLDGTGLSVRLGSSPLDSTVIQNSLNGQAIGAATIIHASVGAQGILQAMHFQSTLATALNNAVTGR
jgi:hypothetical protein